MEKLDMQPHISLKPSQVRPVAIVVGDPKRAESVAHSCDKHKELAYNREYRSFDCYKNGQYFTVISHGVGSAGAAICFEELIKIGVKVIMRVGTAGSLQADTIKCGDIVICHSAAREDGFTNSYVPQGYPAICDTQIFEALKGSAEKLNIPVHYGTTLTSDVFYPSPVLPSSLTTFSKAGVEIVEMEAATLLVIARVRKIKAGVICCVDGCPLKWEEGDYDPTGEKVAAGKQKMIDIATHAAAKITAEKMW